VVGSQPLTIRAMKREITAGSGGGGRGVRAAARGGGNGKGRARGAGRGQSRESAGTRGRPLQGQLAG